MLKRLILTLALLIGAFAMSPSATRAAPLGASAQAAQASPIQVQKAYYYVYRRRYYRPRYHYRYYRPRRYYYYHRPRRYYYYRRYW
ncbi:hypothetical protein [Enterovirga sp.]|uniref:hypothetical protein n=1 Tax=Enterovirga sp. TaxID=2026350 RepID=UPI002D10DB98|nr:hypothetical protein [Enterovirga sp.]HMO30805.1 hypothetical protein [Enterovirga sp.]